jgi:DNA ligase-associated metallophosphoesterase
VSALDLRDTIFIMRDVVVTLQGEQLLLLREKAICWQAQRTLIVADVHFGKAAAFRAGGIPVPGGTTTAMLARLDAAIERTGVTRLLALGDLLHARAGRAPRLLAEVSAWRASHPSLRVQLVRGNHDRRAGDPPPSWDVECLDAPVAESPFIWLHEPPTNDNVAQSVIAEEAQPGLVAPHGYPVAGHVHPAVALNGGGRGLTLPCFYFGRDYALLPAFGEFTGTALVRPRPGERVFVLAGDEIIERPLQATVK